MEPSEDQIMDAIAEMVAKLTDELTGNGVVVFRLPAALRERAGDQRRIAHMLAKHFGCRLTEADTRKKLILFRLARKVTLQRVGMN